MTQPAKKPTGNIGLAWFRKEDYPRLLAISEDPNEMHDTWEAWEASAKTVEARLRAEGGLTERVYIDPDMFLEWCRKEESGRAARRAVDTARTYLRNATAIKNDFALIG